MGLSAILYFTCLSLPVVAGTWRYKRLDAAMRIFFAIALLAAIDETLAYMALAHGDGRLKNIIYYVYDIISVVLTTWYFIKVNRQRRTGVYVLLAAVAWTAVGVLNAAFVRKGDSLDTNIILLESFWIITMSLYTIYGMLVRDVTGNIFRQPHFGVAALMLVYWSSTFFFWAFIKTLYNSHWQYMGMVMRGETTVNLLYYSGAAITIYLSGKKQLASEHI